MNKQPAHLLLEELANRCEAHKSYKITLVRRQAWDILEVLDNLAAENERLRQANERAAAEIDRLWGALNLNDIFLP